MSKYVYGIDFGTSNSAISIIDTTTNEIVQTFNESSLIFFPEPKQRNAPLTHFVGQEAIERYVADNMRGRFMKSIKRILPRTGFKETRVYNKKYKAEDLVCIILQYLKAKADHFVQEDIRTAVFGRPVIFDEDPAKDQLAQDRLSKAAKLAGFEAIAFQMEPIAAAFTYERAIDKEEKVLVADLGGGTSDFTLMKLNPSKSKEADRKEDIIGQGGIYIGGDNFDSAIMWDKGTYHFGRGLTYKDYETVVEVPNSFYHNISSWEKMNFFDTLKLQTALDKFHYLTGRHPRFQNLITLVRENLGYAVFQSIEKAKIELSEKDKVSFGYQQSGIEFDEPISIEAFSNDIIGEDIDKIHSYLLDFLDQSGTQPAEIDTLFMTGGTSMVLPIRKLMIDLFGEAAIKSGDNFNSVSNGLAYSHLLFFK